MRVVVQRVKSSSVKVNEEIVLRKSWIDNRTPCLEIYDDYR